MKILLVGVDREGALLRSLKVAFEGLCHEVGVVDPAPDVTRLVDRRSSTARVWRLLKARDSAWVA